VANHRADWLGRFMVDLRPEVVVDIGDWFALDSLCAYEKKGSRSFEGKRYWKDVDAGIDAQERVKAQVDEYNRGASEPYNPQLERVLGNHEYRIQRFVDEEPNFDTVVGLHDLCSAEFGWNEHAFLDPVMVDGLVYQHYFDKGGKAPSYSTKHLAANTLAHQHRPSVFGHTHRFDYFEEPVGGTFIQVVNCGCYFHHWEDYASNDNRRFRRGLARYS
jgi:hypothetical protein